MLVADLHQYLCDVEKEYEIVKSINKGSFGEVFEGIRCSDNLKVAIKKLFNIQFQEDKNDEGNYRSSRKNLVRELGILAHINHPFCLNLINFSLDPQPMIVTPFMSKGTLLDLIKENDPNLSTQKNCSIYALISAMDFLHKTGMIHRDLKPHNILINDDQDICIADFGLSRKINQNIDLTNKPIGTPLYMAPELIQSEKYTNAVDVYSFGVIYYLYFSFQIKMKDTNAKPPNAQALMVKIARGVRFVKPPNMSDEQYKFYTDCTNGTHEERPTFEQLAERFETDESLWLDGVDKDEFLEYVEKCKKINLEAMKRRKRKSSRSSSASSLSLSARITHP